MKANFLAVTAKAVAFQQYGTQNKQDRTWTKKSSTCTLECTHLKEAWAE